jgi:hypothetical protein
MKRFVVIMGLHYATAAVPLAAQEAAAGKRTPEITNELRHELPSGATPRRSSCKGKERMRGADSEVEWSHVDSNHGPPACEAGALTN